MLLLGASLPPNKTPNSSKGDQLNALQSPSAELGTESSMDTSLQMDPLHF